MCPPLLRWKMNIEFLNEPAWRWFAFLVALMLFLEAWRGVVKEMR